MKKIYLILFSLVASLGSGVKAQETAETVDVTYTYTLDGQTLGTRTVTETVGEAPSDQASIPSGYVNATGYPTAITTETTAYTITTSYKNTMPFGVSNDNVKFYYTLDFTVGGKIYYWRTLYSGTKSEAAAGTPADRFTNPVYRWSIEGDWFNGFLLRNADGKYVTIPETEFATQTGYDVTFEETATERSRFLMSLMSSSDKSWRFRPKTANREIYLAHTSASSLKISLYYRDNYAGWGVQFENILPQDGKAYYLRNYGNDAAHTSYLLRASTTGTLETCAYNDENKTMAALFVCHNFGDKYVFANALTGEYLIWRGNDGGYNGNKGFLAEYNETQCALQLPTNTSYPGHFQLLGKRNDGTTIGTIVLNTSTGAFDKYSENWCNTTSHSNHFVLEEADYPHNSVTLKTPSAADGYNYASLYLPFAAALPEGVEAYTATREAGSDRMTLQPVTEAIPAKTAVVLRSETATSAVFVPAAVATTAVEDNILQGTIETATTTPENTYVLSGAFSAGIGFYPYTARQLPAYKAYLTADDVPAVDAGVKGLLLGSGTSTGIGSIAAEEGRNDANVVYDLSGRRVVKAAKGLYIVNGKKVIVK